MGTINFTVTTYANGPSHGEGGVIPSTLVKTSGAYTTTTSATNVEDGTGDISLTLGDVFRASASEAMWVSFGGTTAAVGTGFYIGADQTFEWECAAADAGNVSVIDVS